MCDVFAFYTQGSWNWNCDIEWPPPPIENLWKALTCEEQEEALSCFLFIVWRKSSKHLTMVVMMMMSPVFIKRNLWGLVTSMYLMEKSEGWLRRSSRRRTSEVTFLTRRMRSLIRGRGDVQKWLYISKLLPVIAKPVPTDINDSGQALK